MNEKRYNPYEDQHLHENQPVLNLQPLDERSGFNDVLESYDIINGHQIPKRLDHLPRPIRGLVKWLILIGVSAFLLQQIWTVITMVK